MPEVDAQKVIERLLQRIARLEYELAVAQELLAQQEVSDE